MTDPDADDEGGRWPRWLCFLIIAWASSLGWALVALLYAIFRSPT